MERSRINRNKKNQKIIKELITLFIIKNFKCMIIIRINIIILLFNLMESNSCRYFNYFCNN